MDKKTLSQKLYFMEGMSVDKISSLLDLRKSEVEDFIKQQDNFQIKSGQGNYEFRVLKGDSISKYSAANYKPFFDSILDQSNIISDFERYYRKYDILGIPEIRTFLKYFLEML